jgi:hypothetical protein
MAARFRDWIIADGEVVANACRSNSRRCVIADAVQKAYPEVSCILVDKDYIRFTDKVAGKRYFYGMTNGLRDILDRFDGGEPIGPFKFRLASRPVQIRPITCRKNSPNKKGRPRNAGSVHTTEKAANYVPTVHGGVPPRVGKSAHGPAGGGKGAWVRENGYRSTGHRVSSVRSIDKASE